LRILTLAGRAYDRDWEEVSDELIAAYAQPVRFGTCVLVRERLAEASSAGTDVMEGRAVGAD
jgi:hypothetical protein